MSNCFTSPDDWKSFEELCSKYPRNIGKSKIFRMAIDAQLKLKNRNTNQSIEDYSDDSYSIDLNSDKSLWISTMKTMSKEEIDALHQLLVTRKSLVADEVARRK